MYTLGDAIVYLSAKNIITAFFFSIAPLIGGLLADFFANRQLNWDIQWGGPNGVKVIHLLASVEFLVFDRGSCSAHLQSGY